MLVVLPGAVDTGDEDDRRARPGLGEVQLTILLGPELLELGLEIREHVLPADHPARAEILADALDEPGRGAHTHVGRDQTCLELIDQVLVERAPEQYRSQRAREGFSCLCQPRLEATDHALEQTHRARPVSLRSRRRARANV
jgi:hypothetical protein